MDTIDHGTTCSAVFIVVFAAFWLFGMANPNAHSQFKAIDTLIPPTQEAWLGALSENYPVPAIWIWPNPFPYFFVLVFAAGRLGVANPKAALESKAKGLTASISISTCARDSEGSAGNSAPRAQSTCPPIHVCALLHCTPNSAWRWLHQRPTENLR